MSILDTKQWQKMQLPLSLPLKRAIRRPIKKKKRVVDEERRGKRSVM